MRIIVSLTSYPPRINSVHKVIESLYRQTVPADEIVLYLSLDEFPETKQDLPETLRSLDGRGGFRMQYQPGQRGLCSKDRRGWSHMADGRTENT